MILKFLLSMFRKSPKPELCVVRPKELCTFEPKEFWVLEYKQSNSYSIVSGYISYKLNSFNDAMRVWADRLDDDHRIRRATPIEQQMLLEYKS